jgi:hypothetical protein
MYLRELEIFDQRGAGRATLFSQFAEPLVQMYEDTLGRVVRTEKTSKVQFFFCPKGHVPSASTNYLGIYTGYVKFDFARWHQLRGFERRLYVLERFHRALRRLAKKAGWPLCEFERARIECIRRKLEYRGLLLRRWVRHPRLKLWANLEFAYDDRKVNVFVTFKDTQGRLLGNLPVMSELSHHDQVSGLVQKLVWGRNGKTLIVYFSLPSIRGVPTIDVSTIMRGFESNSRAAQ